MTPQSQPMAEFLRLVERVAAGTTARSENDLSAKLAEVLSAIGLSPVIDTAVAGGRKRPDILGYVSVEDADAANPAELVIESKKPPEVAQFKSLIDAITDEALWCDKTFPYIRRSISRIHYFGVTTFTDFVFVAITPGIRRALTEITEPEDLRCEQLRNEIREASVSFSLATKRPEENMRAAALWESWMRSHLSADRLGPPPLSSARNAVLIRNERDLDHFAERLAGFAAGSSNSRRVTLGLYFNVRAHVARDSYAQLAPTIARDLLIFLMAQNPGIELAAAERIAREEYLDAIDEFVAASIHSLISRLFAVKVIEDAYCVGIKKPLIEEDRWLFATTAYDELDADEIRTEAFRRLRSLGTSSNTMVRRLAGYGFFFDWIGEYVDPVLLRGLLEIFMVHDFTDIQGDVLGRFYEYYAQQINRSERKALGQYYTPLPVVRFMWSLASATVSERDAGETVTVLDPGMGSGTFLAEGARSLSGLGVRHFWKRLTGFDISAQVMGIANVNVYMAILSQLTQEEAGEVDDLHLYITDTLDHRNGHYLRDLLPLITDEEQRRFIEERVAVSTESKRSGRFFVVIGNPPYKNNSTLTLAQVADRFPRLLESSVANSGAQVRNVRDDYAWFFAAADYYVGERGIICFIVSDSFAVLKSYRFFRESLLRHYHIHLLVRLGAQIFPDVGYRTTFCIIHIERRAAPLDSVDEVDVPVVDLRDLGEAIRAEQAGTIEDPRLLHLERVANGSESLRRAQGHRPNAGTAYTLYPQSAVVDRVLKSSVAIHEKSAPGIFERKWPGLITAFDVLFKGASSEELTERMTSLVDVTRGRHGSRTLEGRLTDWAEARGLIGEEITRIVQVGAQVRASGLAFDPTKIKRSFSGTTPADVRWYPPRSHTHYIYYEPLLHIPRNQNEGRERGWGTMDQWREPDSHLIGPKLIYTTATKPRNGYKAFVVEEEWYVKLHGGTSQQYNYTGLESPSINPRMDGLPNNLAEVGLGLLAAFEEALLPPGAVLHYLSSLWNSDLAQEFLEESPSTSFRIRYPSRPGMEIVARLAAMAKEARDLRRTEFFLNEHEGDIASETALRWAPQAVLARVGVLPTETGGRRFRRSVTYRAADETLRLVSEHVMALEAEMNQLVDTLYS
jgi:hypothetical protein